MSRKIEKFVNSLIQKRRPWQIDLPERGASDYSSNREKFAETQEYYATIPGTEDLYTGSNHLVSESFTRALPTIKAKARLKIEFVRRIESTGSWPRELVDAEPIRWLYSANNVKALGHTKATMVRFIEALIDERELLPVGTAVKLEGVGPAELGLYENVGTVEWISNIDSDGTVWYDITTTPYGSQIPRSVNRQEPY